MLEITSEAQHKIAWDRMDALLGQEKLTDEEYEELTKLSNACLDYVSTTLEGMTRFYESAEAKDSRAAS